MWPWEYKVHVNQAVHNNDYITGVFKFVVLDFNINSKCKEKEKVSTTNYCYPFTLLCVAACVFQSMSSYIKLDNVCV